MKKWWKSKTLWINLATVAAGLVAVFEGNEWIMSNPEASGVVLAAAGFVNFLLRLVTTEGVTK